MGERTEVHRNLYDDLAFEPYENPRIDFKPEAAKAFYPIHKEPPIAAMDEPVIIECACPGWQPAGDHFPAVPETPEEQAQELIDSVEAGAAAIHVHPRDENGIPQMSEEEDLLKRVVDPVFDECGDVMMLQHTWAAGTKENIHIDYVTGAKHLLEMGDGNKYVQGGLILPPGRWGNGYHSLDSITEGVRFFQENGIKPLFQLYDSHVVYELKHKLFDAGEVDMDNTPIVLNVNFGKHHSHNITQHPWWMHQVLAAKNTAEETIPNSIANVYPGGRNWLPVYVMGLLMGGNVFRIGIEDAYWMYPHRDDLIPKNSEIIELAVDIAESMGREVITDFDEAREFLGIEYTSPR